MFYDLGSGVGNVVLQVCLCSCYVLSFCLHVGSITFQVAAQTGCHAVGIEIREELHRIALSLRTHAIELAGTHRGWCFDRTNFKQGDVADASVEFTAGLHISPDKSLTHQRSNYPTDCYRE